MIPPWVWLACWVIFARCLHGPGTMILNAPAECCWSDMDGDGDVDLHDWYLIEIADGQRAGCDGVER